MKEVTYEEWKKNPTPRMMWVWDSNESNKNQRKVIYFLENKHASFPVVALDYDGIITDNYKHCAEIKEPKTRRMTNQELARWLMNGIKDGKYREWKYIYDSVVFNFGSFNYQIDEGSSPVNSTIFIRENDAEWHEPLVEVEE